MQRAKLQITMFLVCLSSLVSTSTAFYARPSCGDGWTDLRDYFALLPRCATASAQHRIRPLEVSTSTRSSPSKQGLVPRAGDPLA